EVSRPCDELRRFLTIGFDVDPVRQIHPEIGNPSQYGVCLAAGDASNAIAVLTQGASARGTSPDAEIHHSDPNATPIHHGHRYAGSDQPIAQRAGPSWAHRRNASVDEEP